MIVSFENLLAIFWKSNCNFSFLCIQNVPKVGSKYFWPLL